MPPNGMICFGKAADPEIDIVEAAERRRRQLGTGGVEEVEAVGRCAVATENEGEGRVALGFDRLCAGDRGVRAVGSNEVDDRRLMLEMAGEIDPTRIGLEQRVLVGGRVELRAGRVQRRNARVTAAGQVDGGEVERQARADCCARRW